MTKDEVIQKIKEILAKDKRFVDATIKIDFRNKIKGDQVKTYKF